MAPGYTVSIPRPPLHAARGFSIHSVNPVSVPTCCAGVEETVASWRGAGASFFGHVQPPGTFSTLPPGAGAPECTVSRISTTEPSEESTMSAPQACSVLQAKGPSFEAPSPAPVSTQGPTEISGYTVPGSIPITHYRT